MKVSFAIAAATLVSLVNCESSTKSLITVTNFITNNDRTYTRTATMEYTGQETTTPTSGTYTSTIYRSRSGSLVPFRTMTDTYGQATTVETSKIVVGPERTYTRPFSRTMHTTEVSSYLSSKAEANSRAQASIDAANSAATTSGSATSASAQTTSATGQAARLASEGVVLCLAAALLL
ncbi:hypothetical protein FDK38_005119 [Candidozyma auris]|nr:hypothetical protein FDK38_005119 [[Candida] auris]